MNWYLTVLKKYAQFDGRARRKEYWYFALFNFIVMVVLIGIDFSVGSGSAAMGFGVLSGIYLLATLIPNLAVSIRRLHDTNRSGWWILIGLIPFIGGIAIIVLMVLEGTAGHNQYGDDPVTD
jgi:uncharacterized membrane protein YhaH (DUF805 family)